MKPRVSIIMGSDSDLSIMSEAAILFDQFTLPYELTIVSAHRTPERMYDYARTAATKGLQVIIAGAGGAAHLPGMVAALTTLPVIGVPIQTKTLSGLDSLYSIVQMPVGIPVATVAINGAKNAGLLAIKILALHDEALQKKLVAFTQSQEATVLKRALTLEKKGYKNYLAEKK